MIPTKPPAIKTIAGAWPNGQFEVTGPRGRLFLQVSDQGGWDHVSVSSKARRGATAPTWDEMRFVRDLCFGPDEWAVQYGPPPAANISHAEVLHWWRPQEAEIVRPPRVFV